MSTNLDALVQRYADEGSRRETERQLMRKAAAKWDVARTILSRIENAPRDALACQLGKEPTPAEEYDNYADLLIRFCRAVREASGATHPPELSPSSDGARIAVDVLRHAFAEDKSAIEQILHDVSKVPQTLGAAMVNFLLVLLRRLLSGDLDTFLDSSASKRQDVSERERKRQERLPVVRRVHDVLAEFKSLLHENYYLRRRPDSTEEDRDRMHYRLADGFIELARRLKAEEWIGELDESLATVIHPAQMTAAQLFQLGKTENRATLLKQLGRLEHACPQDQDDVWKTVAQITDELLIPLKLALGESLLPTAASSQTSNSAASEQTEDEQSKGTGADRAGAAQTEGTSRSEPKGQTMPLSRLDLPRIVEAVQELYRIIEHPPTGPWRAPAWLIEQYKQTTNGEDGLRKIETSQTWVPRERQQWLIDCAAREVLNRIMPPHYHISEDCPEITDSSLDQKHKLKLIELRKLLLTFALGQRLVRNPCEALEVLDFLETTIELLESSPTQKQTGRIGAPNRGTEQGEGTGKRKGKGGKRPGRTHQTPRQLLLEA